jgi:hypothetical protein
MPSKASVAANDAELNISIGNILAVAKATIRKA